jgi:hypothetical protein
VDVHVSRPVAAAVSGSTFAYFTISGSIFLRSAEASRVAIARWNAAGVRG